MFFVLGIQNYNASLFAVKIHLFKEGSIIFFLANNLQECTSNIDVLPSFMSDHSPVFLKLDINMTLNRGNYGWKFNSLLLKDDIFKNECKKDILDKIENFDQNSNPHIKWEYLKYQSRKFAISFSKGNKRATFDRKTS